MKQEEDKWLKALRESMEGYSEPPKANGWEKLEKELAPKPVVLRRSYYMYTAAAAVALIVIISAASIYFVGDKAAQYTQTAQLPADIKEVINKRPINVVEEPTVKDVLTNKKLTAAQPQTTSLFNKVAKNAICYNKTSDKESIMENRVMENKKENTDQVESTSNQSESIQHTKNNDEQSKPKVIQRENRVTELQDYPLLNKKRKKNLSLALTAGNGSGFSSSESVNNSFGSSRLTYFSPLTTANEFMVVKEIPTPELNHKLPLTFGISLRKQLSNRIAIESGLTYTRLESELLNSNRNYATYEQTLHYVGIPVKLSYEFLDTRFLTLYATAGGAVEKCVSGESKTTEYVGINKTNSVQNSLTVKPLQWSVGSAVGVQFNLNKQFGVFAEPGIVYFFKDGSDIQTIRKENPLNFNLQLGLRISY